MIEESSARSWQEAPGPPPPKILGWRGKMFEFLSNPVEFLSRGYERYGRLFCLVKGGNPPLFYDSQRPIGTFFALGPTSTRELMEQSEHLENREPRGPDSGKRLGVNVLFTNGERHKHQRRLLIPPLSRGAFKSYYEDIVEVTHRHLASWRESSIIDLDKEMSELTLATGSKVFFGLESNRGSLGLAQMMGEMLHLLFSPTTMIHFDLPGFPYRRLIRLTQTIESELDREIAAKKAAGARGQDLLSSLVRLHMADPTQVTADELVGQAFTIFFAGHDTTAKGLVWTLFLLAQHPGVAAELYEELERELGGEPPSLVQVMELPVLDRVVKESLRILSPAVMFNREVVKPIEIAGHCLPIGSEVFYSPYVVHHDPLVYKEPKRFDPNRWLEISPSKYEYLPFGVGPRTCLGGNFASFQLRLVLAMICQRYRLEVVENTRIDLKTTVVIGPKHALPVKVHRQDREFHKSPASVRGYILNLVDLPQP